MSASLAPRPSLDDSIAQLIELGEKDPREIARKIESRSDRDWLVGELLASAGEIIAERARHGLASERRRAQAALRPGDEVASSEMRIKSVWVPGSGWTRASDLTVGDVDAVARFYARLEEASGLYRRWWEQVAAMMRAEGAETLGRMMAPLPPLPAGELEAATT